MRYMYGILGAFMGSIGTAAFLLDIQQYFALLLGVAVLVLVFRQSWLNKITAKYQQSKFMQLIRKKVLNRNSFKTPKGKLLAGMGNGLLPCGLVYVALAGAMAQKTVGDGMLYMILFGAGTLPALILTQLIPFRWLQKPVI